MFFRDADKMKEICSRWGIKFRDSFASAQMLRPYDQKKNIYQKISDNGTPVVNSDVMKMQSKMKDDIREVMQTDMGFP